jgi:hypothetical protein
VYTCDLGHFKKENEMARWILLIGLVTGFWMKSSGMDLADFVRPSVAAPDVQVMDGADPFPPQ